jgi:cytidylate kinase
MKGLDEMAGYLRSAAFNESGDAAQARAAQPFITISRQAGAGGSAVAEEILRQARGRLGLLWSGWSVLDRTLAETVAKDPNLSVVIDSLRKETFRAPLSDYLTTVLADQSPQAAVLARVFKTIRTAAGMGKIVVVGRGGNLVTGMLRMGVHLRLVASKDCRLETLMGRYRWDRVEAERRMEEMERARRLLVSAYFKKDIDDPLLYDAVINVERVPREDIARFALDMVERKAAEVLAASR